MKKTDPTITDSSFTQLRQEAEKHLDQTLMPEPPPVEKLLHELRVHQVELEMQNEQLRQSQVELEKSRDRYVDFYDFAPVGYLTLSHEGIIEEINLTGAELLKVERSRLLNHRFSPYVATQDIDRWYNHFLSALKEDRILSCELMLKNENGPCRYAILDCRRHNKNEGKEMVLRVALTDITKRRQIETELEQHRLHLEDMIFSRTIELAESRDAAEAANRAKSVFLSNMSHELRTPMNGIMGTISLALRLATDPKQIEWLTRSNDSSEQLLALINNILEVSQSEAEPMMMQEENFSLSQAINESLHIHDAIAQAKELILTSEISFTLPDQVYGDVLCLKRILVIFIDNAIKFSERGQITVRALVIEEFEFSLLLRIEVSDQGMGINPAQQARLFHAFDQLDDTSTRKHGGAGLGLNIAKRIALLMGGTAGVNSQEGVGSTFWTTLLLKRSSPFACNLMAASPMSLTERGER